MKETFTSRFQALSVARKAAAACVALAKVLRNPPKDLTSQITRAAISIPLNLAEGSGFRGRRRVQHFRIAYASALEAREGIELAVTLGCITQGEASNTLGLLDRTCALCYRLSHPKR